MADQPTESAKTIAEAEPEPSSSELETDSNSEALQRTSEVYHTEKLPERFEFPHWFQGYGAQKQQNPVFKTSSSSYGSLPPTVHEMPIIYKGKNRRFTEHLGKCGMYRNNSLNTGMDKDKPT